MALYTVKPVEEADIARVSELVVDGLIQDGYAEYAAATWPGLDTPEGKLEAQTRFASLRKHLANPDHFLKVVDESTGDIVATSVAFYSQEPPKMLSGLSGDAWSNDDDRSYAQHLRKERNALLLRAFAALQGPVTEIMAFFVEASVQRQGVGRALMRHLINMDAQQGRPLVLIANPNAVGFYLRQGFRVVEDSILATPEAWQNRPRSHLVSMIRVP